MAGNERNCTEKEIQLSIKTNQNQGSNHRKRNQIGKEFNKYFAILSASLAHKILKVTCAQDSKITEYGSKYITSKNFLFKHMKSF